MFRKVLSIAAVIAACTAEPPVQPHYSSGEAVSSQSFTRHDVPLSYKQISTHPRYVAKTITSVTATPVHYAPTDSVSYVTPAPQYSAYSTPTSEQIQYSTPGPQYSHHTETEYAPAQSLHTKVAPSSPSENRARPEFTQAYFLPKSSPHQQSQTQYSGHDQRMSLKTGTQRQYYVMQPQYSTGPVQFQQSEKYPTYQTAQQSPALYVASVDGQNTHRPQEYAYPQYELAYRLAVPSNGKGQHLATSAISKTNGFITRDHNGYEQLTAPVVAKLSPAVFKSVHSFAKSTPIYVQASQAYAKPTPVYTTSAPVYTPSAPVYTPSAPVYTASAPVYTASAPVYTKPTLNYAQIAQPASGDTKAVTQYIETTPSFSKTAPSYIKAATQYVDGAPSYSQTTKLYAIPSYSQQYYQLEH